MDVTELIPGLHFLRLPVGHAYLCHDPDGLTLIDISVPGSAPQIATALRALGHDPADLRRLMLTHFHTDHAGSAAEIAAWGNIEVCAHHADAPYLRGEAPGPPQDLPGWERPLFDQVSRHLPAAPPAPVWIDRELHDGDELAFGGGAIAVAVPGHTPGSVAFYLPGPRVLFAGDTAARRPDGQVIPGVFNTDRAQAAVSFPPARRPRRRHHLSQPRRTHHPARSSLAAEGRPAARRSQAMRWRFSRRLRTT